MMCDWQHQARKQLTPKTMMRYKQHPGAQMANTKNRDAL
jgi:hypothetical protein